MTITITIPNEQIPIIESQLSNDGSLKADIWITQQVQSMVNQVLQADKRNQLSKYGLTPTANLDQATIDKLKLILTPLPSTII